MANPDHLAIIGQGVRKWNAWRDANSKVQPDLKDATLSGLDLSSVVLHRADLAGADLKNTRLVNAYINEANVIGADLRGADLMQADLSKSDFSTADLTGADLTRANLAFTNFTGSKLTRATLAGASIVATTLRMAICNAADLSGATLVRADLRDADLTAARVYGLSAWDLQLTGTFQRDLIITPKSTRSMIRVDNIEVAQFIYLMLNNDRIRDVITSITSKVVLILGRFTPERKAVLDAIRDELRNRDYLPVVFDFEKPSNRDITETVSTLAHMARFVIADLTDARSVPQELASIVPALPSLPVQPILLASEREYTMYEHFGRYPWVLPIVQYETTNELLANLPERVIGPAERRLTAARGSDSSR